MTLAVRVVIIVAVTLIIIAAVTPMKSRYKRSDR